MTRERKYLILALLVIIPAGFYTKFYSGPFELIAHNYLGGFFYEIFWILLFVLFFSRAKAFTVALTVFAATCGIEFLQLWHPPFLELLRSNFIGRTVLGNSFTWYDFPWYLAGSFAGCLLAKGIKKAAQKPLH